ncbi:MAG: RES domain-containing protein [Gammaproteobacteria bacterium]|jgi:RES domain-containing protein
MKVYRLARKKYKMELSGKGAALSGNRWNSKGTELVYCADSRALAATEVLVHLSIATMPSDFVMLEINVPATIEIKSLPKSKLPIGWSDFPHNVETQFLGDDFAYTRETCALKVPSAAIPGDFNLLINPRHPQFSKIKIVSQEDFPFDMRLVR